MRRVGWLLALLAFGLLAGAASAQSNAAFNGLCSSGGRNAIVQGLNSTNYLSGIVPKCTITVYLTGTTTPATIFANAGGTPLANPFTANALGSAAPGSWLFFAATGQGYDVVMSGGIAPNTFPLPVTLTDLLVGGGSGPSGTCGPLDSDATSTNCGNGNFTGFVGNHSQAYGFDNISGLTNASNADIVGLGTSTVSGSSALTSDVVGIGDTSATGLSGGNNIVGIGNTSASNFGNTAADVIGIGDGSGNGFQHAVADIIAIGDGAGDCGSTAGCAAMTTGPSDMVAIGDGAGSGYGGTAHVAIGLGAGGGYLSNSHDVVSIGDGAGGGPELANGTPTATINNAISVGNLAGANNAGNEVIAIGDHVLTCTTCQSGTTAGNTGIDNIAIGDHALPVNTTGNHNIAIGYYVGGNGYVAGIPTPTIGNSNQTGSQNTWIGDTSGPISTTQLSNTVALGYGANPTVSNQTVIGNNSITAVTIYGVGTGCLSASSGVITGSGSACGSGGGGGSNVTVNGGSTLTTANFGTLPAAGSNGLNVTWQNSGNNVSAEIVGDGVSTHFLNGNGGWTAPAGGGSGTVTSVSFTGGLISVATATTTPALTVAGTSGGVPYFSGAATWASSAALPSGDFVLGGGAGSAPTASFSIVTAAKGGTGIANTATLTLGTSNQNWATLGTGIVKNTTTTGALTNAASSDVIGLWTGSCSSSTFLRGDGACAAASGSSGISGLTAGFLPIAGSSTTLTANSHIDDGVTTAATLTASEPLAVTGSPGIIMAHASAASGVAGSVVYTVDPTNGYGEMNQNNAGLERIAGWNTANVFTANQTAPSWIASGSGAGSLVLTNGTAPSAVSSSVQLIAPTTVTTGYNFTFPAGAPGSTLNQMIQCSGASSALCAFAPLEVIGGSFPTGACSGNYFVNTTADGYSSYCNGTTYLNTPPGSSGLAAPLIAGQVSGNYYGYSVNNTLVAGNMLGFFADSTNTDTSVYVNVRTNGGFKVKVNNGTAIFYSSAAGIAANTFQTATIYSAAGTPIPTCNSGSHGSIGVVSDATIPTYLGTYTSGGAVEAVVECNGTNWITQ